MSLNDPLDRRPLSRRTMLQSLGAVGLIAGADRLLPDWARSGAVAGPRPALVPRTINGESVHELDVATTRLRIDGRATTATTINGTVPGPLIRLREGSEAVLRVRNHLEQDTSIHWHGLLVPSGMDGVPGLSFPGIAPGEMFEYRFAVGQAGTYWYHSHSGLQEQLGHYGPLVIDPADPYPHAFDREFTVVLSDWTFESPYRILDRLKKQPDYFNFQRRTVGDFFRDVAQEGFMPTLRDRMMWSSMRMNPTDITDVTGATYSFLLNGLAAEDNWTGIFRPGERVLLRIINAAAGSYFDVRVPGVPMTVVGVSGQYVEPVETEEFRIAIAETYDVIVQLPDDRPYTIFAEAMDRSGFAAGTLATQAGQRGELPSRRRRPTLSMMDMGMSMGMDHAGMPGMGGGAMGTGTRRAPPGDEHAGHDMPAGAVTPPTKPLRAPGTLPEASTHGRDRHGVGNAMTPMNLQSRLAEPGAGLGEDGRRVLVYTDLRALSARADFRAPLREVELHLTGNMERFMWAIDGVPFRDAAPIEFTFGERLRLTLVNDTMMNHPMHLHGMWMELENGHGDRCPRVHTVNVKPSEKVSLLVTADAPGRWAFHCHVLLHMEVGMFREVRVSGAGHTGHEGDHRAD